jgi:hypothetical protein
VRSTIGSENGVNNEMLHAILKEMAKGRVEFRLNCDPEKLKALREAIARLPGGRIATGPEFSAMLLRTLALGVLGNWDPGEGKPN